MNQASEGWRKRQIALDIKAENARELGLDYEPERTTIYIVRKHRITRFSIGGYYIPFELYGAYKTYAEAHKVAVKKNAKSKDYIYMARKLVVK